MTRKESKRIMESVMPRYQGKLTKEQGEEGAHLAHENAKRLLKSARLLLDSGDAPTAMSLSILALEENGKIEIIKTIVDAKNPQDIEDGWARYHDHKSKTFGFLECIAVLKNLNASKDINSYCKANSDILPLIDLMKQLGLYTDCSGKCRWHDPRKISTILAIPLLCAAEKAILGKNQVDVIKCHK